MAAARFFDLPLAGIIQETPDARSFVFEIPAALRSLFEYRAGQFLTLEVPWNGLRLRRCYSLASAPETDPLPKVTVKRVPEGRVSNWLCDTLRIGDRVAVQPPEGRFVLAPAEQRRPLTLLGAGSGITPLLSLLKSALASTDRHVRLVYANRQPGAVIFQGELDLLVRRHPGRLEVVHHLVCEHGHLGAAEFAAHLAGREDGDVYLCGPDRFMDTALAGLDLARVPAERRHHERFHSPTDPDHKPAVAAPAPATAISSLKMTLNGAERSIPYEAGQSILQAAERAGCAPPSSCQDGYCGCCMGLVRSGRVELASREALTDRDIERGWIIACQARPAGSEPVWVDFDAQY